MVKGKAIMEKADPRISALIVVDMQNDFCHPRGAFAKWGEDMSMIQDMVPRLKELIEAARKADLPIIYLRNTESEWTTSQVFLERIREARGEEGQVITWEGSWGAEFYEDIGPVGEERVVIKHRYSGFIDTDLDLILRSRGVRCLVLTGVATNVCVESTARDGFMKDYRVVLVEDCCATTHKNLHEATVENIGRYFGTAVSYKDLISTWAAEQS